MLKLFTSIRKTENEQKIDKEKVNCEYNFSFDSNENNIWQQISQQFFFLFSLTREPWKFLENHFPAVENSAEMLSTYSIPSSIKNILEKSQPLKWNWNSKRKFPCSFLFRTHSQLSIDISKARPSQIVILLQMLCYVFEGGWWTWQRKCQTLNFGIFLGWQNHQLASTLDVNPILCSYGKYLHSLIIS